MTQNGKAKNYYPAQDIADLQRLLQKSQIKRIHVACSDLGGTWRSKLITKAECLKALQKNRFSLCDLIFAWDANDFPYPSESKIEFSSYQTGFPDLSLRAVPKLFTLPHDPTTGLLILEVEDRGEHLCPRGIVRELVAKLHSQKLQCKMGIELEFYVFRESYASMSRKNFQDIDYFSTGNFTWSALRSMEHSEFYDELLDYLQSLGIPVLSMHTETGPGAMEISLDASDPLQLADQAIMTKHFIKIFCARKGLLATFMAKWHADLSGLGIHLHYSFADLTGQPVLFDKSEPQNMSKIMLQCIAGQMRCMGDFMLLAAPNINSYARLVPYHFAPYTVSWGFDNRTTAIRAILASPRSQRLEYRIPGADANPYLAVAAVLAATLDGLQQDLHPASTSSTSSPSSPSSPSSTSSGSTPAANSYRQLPPPCLGDAYETTAERETLPLTLESAALAFQKSTVARQIFDPRFVDHYSRLKLAETLLYARTVNTWQLQRYLDYC